MDGFTGGATQQQVRWLVDRKLATREAAMRMSRKQAGAIIGRTKNTCIGGEYICAFGSLKGTGTRLRDAPGWVFRWIARMSPGPMKDELLQHVQWMREGIGTKETRA
jgi:hypothetical protein